MGQPTISSPRTKILAWHPSGFLARKQIQGHLFPLVKVNKMDPHRHWGVLMQAVLVPASTELGWESRRLQAGAEHCFKLQMNSEMTVNLKQAHVSDQTGHESALENERQNFLTSVRYELLNSQLSGLMEASQRRNIFWGECMGQLPENELIEKGVICLSQKFYSVSHILKISVNLTWRYVTVDPRAALEHPPSLCCSLLKCRGMINHFQKKKLKKIPHVKPIWMMANLQKAFA